MTQQNTSTPIWVVYLLGWITGLIFLAAEKKDETVRWHAANALVVFGAASILGSVLSAFARIPWIGWLFGVAGGIVGIATFVIWIVMMVKGSQGEKVRVPIATDFAEQNCLNLFK